jgi:hypothetical protein
MAPSTWRTSTAVGASSTKKSGAGLAQIVPAGRGIELTLAGNVRTNPTPVLQPSSSLFSVTIAGRFAVGLGNRNISPLNR